jgi:hypothetical protein
MGSDQYVGGHILPVIDNRDRDGYLVADDEIGNKARSFSEGIYVHG